MSKGRHYSRKIGLLTMLFSLGGAATMLHTTHAGEVRDAAHSYSSAAVVSPADGDTSSRNGNASATPLDANSQRSCMNQCQLQGAQCNAGCSPGDLMCTNRCIQQQAQCYGSCK